MPIAAATDALTTVANARAYLKRPSTNPTETDTLQLYINSYSRAIGRYTRRQFLPAETGKSKKFRYLGNGYLSLEPYEATVVTAVVLHTDLAVAAWRTLAAQTTTQESEYRLEPRNKTPEATYLWLALPELGNYNPYGAAAASLVRARRDYEATVTGDWGVGSVPADVEMACLIAVANAFRNPESFQTRNLAQFGFTEEPVFPTSDDGGAALPRDSRALLVPYRRKTLG